jgi:hypothetical protein
MNTSSNRAGATQRLAGLALLALLSAGAASMSACVYDDGRRDRGERVERDRDDWRERDHRQDERQEERREDEHPRRDRDWR